MIITVTERGTFKRCRRRWDYSSRNRQNLEPVVNAPALTLGFLIHKTLEEWAYQSPNITSADEVDNRYMQLASQQIEQASVDYRERVGAKISMEEIGPVLDQLEVGRSMLQNYLKRYGQPLPKGYKLVQMEQTCLIDIPGADDSWLCLDCGDEFPTKHSDGTCRSCGSARLDLQHGRLEATLDGLIMNEEGELLVLERKTYKARPRIDRLMLNDQFTAYGWVVTKLETGYPFGGVLYDGLWKRKAPTKAKPKFEDLFLRHKITIDHAQIEDFERHLAAEYNDMLACKAGGELVYPNRRWEGCYDCGFDRLCAAQTRGEDVAYIRYEYYKTRARDERFTEEDDPDDE